MEAHKDNYSKIVQDKIKNLVYISLDELKIIQGDLKSLDKNSYEKFKKQILEVGFSSPFHVWNDGKKYDILDGTTRYKVLKMMEQEGILLPKKFPAVEIIASDIKTAKKILLGLASNYAKMTDESLSEFAIESDISLDWININIDLPFNSTLQVDGLSESKELKNTSKELNEDDFKNFNNKCPRCNFEWNNNE